MSEIPQGHAIKIDTTEGHVVVSHLVACDRAGVIVARAAEDCTCKDPKCTLDLRLGEVRVHKGRLSTDATLLASIALALLVIAFMVMASAGT